MKAKKFTYKCQLCNQKWKTKYLYDRHVLMCELSLNSSQETIKELEELQHVPSSLELYKIIQEVYVKQQKMQKQINAFEKYIQQKKKKINSITWLSKTYPDIPHVSVFMSTLTITDEHIQTIFDTNIINAITNILVENNIPIKCFESRPNHFYAFENNTWKILSTLEFDNILQSIIRLIYTKFNGWYEAQKLSNANIQELYCKYCNKLFNGKQDIASQNRTIKMRFYKQTKIAIKEIYEYEFEF